MEGRGGRRLENEEVRGGKRRLEKGRGLEKKFFDQWIIHFHSGQIRVRIHRNDTTISHVFK